MLNAEFRRFSIPTLSRVPPSTESSLKPHKESLVALLYPCSFQIVRYLRPSLHLVLIAHMPEAYDAFVHAQPPLRTLQNVELLHRSSIMRSDECIWTYAVLWLHSPPSGGDASGGGRIL